MELRVLMEGLRAASLLAAALTMGVVTGVFQLYAYAIMPGLGRTDDRTFVGAFQQIDRAILNPWFFTSLFGALGFTAGFKAFAPWLAAVRAELNEAFSGESAPRPALDAAMMAGDQVLNTG